MAVVTIRTEIWIYWCIPNPCMNVFTLRVTSRDTHRLRLMCFNLFCKSVMTQLDTHI